MLSTQLQKHAGQFIPSSDHNENVRRFEIWHETIILGFNGTLGKVEELWAYTWT